MTVQSGVAGQGMPNMSIARDAELTVPVNRPHALARAWQAECRAFRRFGEVAHLVEGLTATAFQSPCWLDSWFETFAADPGVEPFLVTLRDRDGLIVLALPLVRLRSHGLRVLEFPDFGVSDYAAPMLRPSSPLPEIGVLWPLLTASFPKVDVINFARLAPVVAGMRNPLADHPDIRRNRLAGWVVALPASRQDYLASISARQRKNLGQVTRRFASLPEARAETAADPAEALHFLNRLDAMQGGRIKTKGLAYRLDEPLINAFYRRLVDKGLASGAVVVAALKVSNEIVAANFATIHAETLVYLRVASAYGELAKYSLGIVVTDYMISEAQTRGVRSFDFGMGDYEYKRRLGAREVPLLDLIVPVTALGAPFVMLWRARQALASSTLLRRLTGRGPACKPGCDATD